MKYKVGNRIEFLEREAFGEYKRIEGTIIKRNGWIFETQLTEYLVELEGNTVTKVRRYNIVGAKLPNKKREIPMPKIHDNSALKIMRKPTPPPVRTIKNG
jgi:hypothetical protein